MFTYPRYLYQSCKYSASLKNGTSLLRYSVQVPTHIKTPKAVIINLHHGAFVCGSGSTSDLGSPEYIIHHDIIYVTFNYRLHVLGRILEFYNHRRSID